MVTLWVLETLYLAGQYMCIVHGPCSPTCIRQLMGHYSHMLLITALCKLELKANGACQISLKSWKMVSKVNRNTFFHLGKGFKKVRGVYDDDSHSLKHQGFPFMPATKDISGQFSSYNSKLAIVNDKGHCTFLHLLLWYHPPTSHEKENPAATSLKQLTHSSSETISL